MGKKWKRLLVARRAAAKRTAVEVAPAKPVKKVVVVPVVEAAPAVEEVVDAPVVEEQPAAKVVTAKKKAPKARRKTNKGS